MFQYSIKSTVYFFSCVNDRTFCRFSISCSLDALFSVNWVLFCFLLKRNKLANFCRWTLFSLSCTVFSQWTHFIVKHLLNVFPAATERIVSDQLGFYDKELCFGFWNLYKEFSQIFSKLISFFFRDGYVSSHWMQDFHPMFYDRDFIKSFPGPTERNNLPLF